jgi:hypothetical protein
MLLGQFHCRCFVFMILLKKNNDHWSGLCGRMTNQRPPFITIWEQRFAVTECLRTKNGVFWDVSRVAYVKTDVSQELSASFISDKIP